MGETCKARTAYTVLSDPSDHRERECNVALAYFSENFYPYFVEGFLLPEILIFRFGKMEEGLGVNYILRKLLIRLY